MCFYSIHTRILSIAILLSVAVVPICAAGKKPAPKKAPVQKTAAQKAKDKTTTTNPARRWDIHHIAVWGGAGYSGLVHSPLSGNYGADNAGIFDSKFIGGGGGILGVGYEYKYKRFILSVGPEFKLFSSADKFSFSVPYDQPLSDYEGMVKHYCLDAMRENQVLGQITLPVLFGGTFDEVYFKAGAKIGYTVLGRYHQRGTLTTTITDVDAYDPEWADILSHGAVTDAKYSVRGKNPYGLDVALTAEVGVNIDQLLDKNWRKDNEKREHPLRLRVALFADYGLNNLSLKDESASMITTTEQNLSSIACEQSEWGAGRLNSLLVGVKFTAMLQMNKVKDLRKTTPLLNVYTTDAATGAALSGVSVVARNTATGKERKKTSSNKGIAGLKLAEGEYAVTATRQGFIPSEEVLFTHTEDKERLDIALQPVPVYTLYVLDAKTQAPVSAQVRFVATDTEKEVAQAHTDAAGKYTVTLPMGASYEVHIDATGYFALQGSVSALDATDKFSLQPIEKKKTMILHNLYFATNATTILPESEQALADLYEMLTDNPTMRIRLTGHTDAVGSDRDNQILSEGRANSVRQNMIDRGIDPDRIEAMGKGKSEPIAPNDTEEGRAKNRRVEMTIL